MDYSNRKYVIVYTIDADQVNFNEVMENSIESARHSVDGSKLIVKWVDPYVPLLIHNIEEYYGPYSHDEILNILNSPEWVETEAQ